MSGVTTANALRTASANAGNLERENEQRAAQGQPQASVWDVWSHTATEMRRRAESGGPPENMDPALRAGLVGPWHHTGGGAAVDATVAQASAIKDEFLNLIGEGDPSKNPEGALQNIGAFFGLLTSVEQLVSIGFGMIPFPAFPALRILDMDIGLPHAHAHPPNIPPPPPIPLPSTGPVIPIPILSGAMKTLINGMPAARCGDMGLGIWCGGYFPMYEIFLGSANVWIEGCRAARTLVDITNHCIFTARPKPGDPPIGVFVGTTITGSPNVLIGGVPMPSLLSAAMGLAFRGLGKLLGRAGRAVGRGLGRLGRRLGRSMKPGLLRCWLLRAEPVNAVTGEVVVEQEDFHLAWRIPIIWTRRYASQNMRSGACGHGWETPADARLEFHDDGTVTFYDGQPGAAIFPRLPDREPVTELVDGAVLARAASAYVVQTKGGLTHHFPIPHIPPVGVTETLVDLITDASGNRLQFVRDRGVLREIRDDSGLRLEFHARGHRISEIFLHHPNERQQRRLVRYDYNQAGDLSQVFDAVDRPYDFEYENHRLIRHTNRNRLSFYYEYDVAKATSPCHRAFGDHGLYDYRFEFDNLRRRSKVINDKGNAWILESDERDLPVREIDPLGGVTQYSYDDVGRTIAVVNPVGKRTGYQYDGRGNLIEVQHPDGSTVATEYDRNSRPIKLTDPNGHSWLQEWDERRLLQSRTSPRGGVTRFSYNHWGDPTGFTDALGNQTQLLPDRFGNLIGMIDPYGRITRYEVDALGNNTSVTDRSGAKWSYGYDAKGRLIDVTSPLKRTTRYKYDGEDNLIGYLDELGRQTRFEYFALGELARRSKPDGTSVSYRYDNDERLVEILNEKGQSFVFERDPLGRVIAETDYWGNTVQYEYDAAGTVLSKRNERGEVVSFKYDAVGRLAARHSSLGGREEFSYDRNGNLVEARSPNRVVRCEYDQENNLVLEQQGKHQVTNDYDLNGNRIRRRSSHGNAVGFAFDQNDDVVGITINGNAYELRRDERGFIREEILSTRVRRSNELDADALPARQAVATPWSSVIDRRYEFDAARNLAAIHDREKGRVAFHYDTADRTTDCTRPSRPPEIAKPMIEMRVPGAAARRLARHGETQFDYDASGNLVTRQSPSGRAEFAWDEQNRLVKARSERHADIRFGYDAEGRRVYKDTDGTPTDFVWDGFCLLSDQLGDERVREFVFYPHSFVPFAAIMPGGETLFFQNSPNGAPHDVLNDDGRRVWSADYTIEGFAEESDSCTIENPLRLQGQYYDRETGLHYNLHRYYDPNAGEFISKDPLGPDSHHDLYAYGSNCQTWADPLGLNCWNQFQRAIKRGMAGLTPAERAAAWKALKNGRGRMARPVVTDSRLQNIVNDLYKGDRMPDVLGHGSTADAARIERATGKRLFGRNHEQKAQEYSNALNNWLRRNPSPPASAADRAAAQGMLDDMQNALAGH